MFYVFILVNFHIQTIPLTFIFFWAKLMLNNSTYNLTNMSSCTTNNYWFWLFLQIINFTHTECCVCSVGQWQCCIVIILLCAWWLGRGGGRSLCVAVAGIWIFMMTKQFTVNNNSKKTRTRVAAKCCHRAGTCLCVCLCCWLLDRAWNGPSRSWMLYNHGEGPYEGLLMVQSGYYCF